MQGHPGPSDNPSPLLAPEWFQSLVLNPGILCKRKEPGCLRVNNSTPMTSPELKRKLLHVGSEQVYPIPLHPFTSTPWLSKQKHTLSGVQE